MDAIWTKGSRKTSVARAKLIKGSGSLKVNGKEAKEYFSVERLYNQVIKPLTLTNTMDKYDILINVIGGGINGQAEAVRHAISRALVREDAEAFKAILKSNGFLKRDPRMVERKKYGRKKARKQFQFSKR